MDKIILTKYTGETIKNFSPGFRGKLMMRAGNLLSNGETKELTADGVTIMGYGKENNVYLAGAIDGRDLQVRMMMRTAQEHLPQDSMSARVLRISENSNSFDVGFFSQGDGVSMINKNTVAVDSGIIAASATMTSTTEAYRRMKTEPYFSRMMNQIGSRGRGIDITDLEENVIVPALLAVLTNIESTEQAQRRNLQGASTLQLGITIPNPDKTSHKLVLYSVSGQEDIGQVIKYGRDNRRPEAIFLPSTSGRSFIMPGMRPDDILRNLRRMEIDLPNGTSAAITTDGVLNKFPNGDVGLSDAQLNHRLSATDNQNNTLNALATMVSDKGRPYPPSDDQSVVFVSTT